MISNVFKTLSSERLILRKFKKSDLEAFVAYRADPEVAQYQGWENFTSADGRKFIEEQYQHDIDVPGTWFQIAIELKTTAKMIGDCAVHTLAEDSRHVELGFTLSRTHQGQGYAEEAVRCLLDFLFGHLKKHRVIAITDAENKSASRLLERIGFRCEGHFIQNVWFKGKWGDEFLYAILREEWHKNKNTL